MREGIFRKINENRKGCFNLRERRIEEWILWESNENKVR